MEEKQQQQDLSKEVELLKSTLHRLGIQEIDTNATPEILFDRVQKNFVERIMTNDDFLTPIRKEGYGRAMGTVASKLKQAFGVKGSEDVEELIEMVKSTQSVDSQEVAKAKRIAMEAESKLQEYESKILPEKLSEIEKAAKQHKVDMQLESLVSKLQLVTTPDVTLLALKPILQQRYLIDVVDGKLSILNKNGTSVTANNAITPLPEADIIKKILDEIKLLANNNIQDDKKKEAEKVLPVSQPKTIQQNEGISKAQKHLESLLKASNK